MAIGKFYQLEKVLKRMKKLNKKPQSNTQYELVHQYELTDQNIDVLTAPSDQNGSIWIMMLCPAVNFFKFVSLLFIFNVVSLNYIGITMGLTSLLQIDPYLLFILSAIFESIGISICFINDRIGRKKALFAYMFLMSVAFVIVAFLPDNAHLSLLFVIKIMTFLFARTMLSASFNTLFVFTAEFFDVKIRNTALTILGSFGFAFSLISPQINMLKSMVWAPLPFLIYATTGFFSCLILSFLPETYHKK